MMGEQFSWIIFGLMILGGLILGRFFKRCSTIFIMPSLIFPILPFPMGPKEEGFNPNLYLTPTLKYSVIGKGLSLMYEPQLVSMVNRINQELKSERFELIDVNRSPMASIGFFANPSSLTPSVRFLGVTARVNIKLSYFPDNDWGRMADAMDAFGKDLLTIIGDTLGGMQEIGVRGAVLVLLYSKLTLNDPNYYEQAEAVVIFIPRETLNEFNAFRLKFNQLYEQSEIFAFKGKDQIKVLFEEFLQG